MPLWKCSCGTQRPDLLHVCPECGDCPPYRLTEQQAAIARGVVRLMAMGLKYGEYREAPPGWERRGGSFREVSD